MHLRSRLCVGAHWMALTGAFGAALSLTLFANHADAQACCGRMDLPMSAVQRAGSRAGEVGMSLAYKYSLADDGLVTPLVVVDRVHTNQFAFDVGYGLTPWLTANVTLPLSAKLIDERIRDREEQRRAVGIGDVMLLAKITLLGANAYASTAPRLSLAPGIKLPTGEHLRDDAFGRIPPPAQSGTGSTDGLLAVFASFGPLGEGTKLLLLGHTLLRVTTENGEGYRFGHRLDASVAAQWAVSDTLAVRGGPAVEVAEADHLGAITVDSSGGLTLFGRAGVAWSFATDAALSFDLEVPVLRSVAGDQLDPVIGGSLGLIVSSQP